MKVLTWNLFYELVLRDERLTESLKRILAADPDVICLQEVHHQVCDRIVATLQHYHLPSSEVQIGRVKTHKYSTLTFTKDPQATCEVIQFPRTFMSRDMLEVSVSGLKIVNVHLESTNRPQFRDIRSEQLTTLHNLHRGGKVVVCGDFNINGPVTTEGFRELHLEGSTYFSSRFHSDRNFEAQFDHVMYSEVNCTFVQHVGSVPYTKDQYCSDHNGIIFTVNA